MLNIGVNHPFQWKYSPLIKVSPVHDGITAMQAMHIKGDQEVVNVTKRDCEVMSWALAMSYANPLSQFHLYSQKWLMGKPKGNPIIAG